MDGTSERKQAAIRMNGMRRDNDGAPSRTPLVRAGWQFGQIACLLSLSGCSVEKLKRALGDETGWTCFLITVTVVVALTAVLSLSNWSKKGAIVIGLIVLGGGFWVISQDSTSPTEETAQDPTETKPTQAKSKPEYDTRLAEIAKANIDTAPFEKCINDFERDAQRAANRTKRPQQFFCRNFMFQVNGPTNIQSRADCQRQEDPRRVKLQGCMKQAFGKAAGDKANSIKPGTWFRIPFWRSYKPGARIVDENGSGNRTTQRTPGTQSGRGSNTTRGTAQGGGPSGHGNTSPSLPTQRGPRARASISGAPFVLGAMHPDDATGRISGSLSTLAACFQPTVDAGATAGGAIKIELKVKKTGAVKKSTIKDSSLNADVGRCVQRALKRVNFPADPGGESNTVTASFRFQAE